jgi:hypothetical protein
MGGDGGCQAVEASAEKPLIKAKKFYGRVKLNLGYDKNATSGVDSVNSLPL